jgi:hypothetical protein
LKTPPYPAGWNVSDQIALETFPQHLTSNGSRYWRSLPGSTALDLIKKTTSGLVTGQWLADYINREGERLPQALPERFPLPEEVHTYGSL